MSVAEKFEVIADAVYEKGVADGKALGGDGVDWDIIQNKGNREYWHNAFAYWGSGDINPKYIIKPSTKDTLGAQSMFQGSYVINVNWSKFDFSECVTFYTAFNGCPFLVSIDVDLTPTSTATNVWGYFCSGAQSLKRIQKMVTKLTHAYQDSFKKCGELEEIRFAPYDAEKGIGIANDISFADSPKLTRESIVSILEALANNLSTTKTLTFSSELGNVWIRFERILKDQIVGDDGVSLLDKTETVYFPDESGTINGVTYNKRVSYIELSGTSTAETRINLLNTPIVFPETPSDTVKDMSLQGVQYINEGTKSQYGYLRATVQRTDGIVEEVYLDEFSSGHFYQGDTITSIDLVIPEGVAFGAETTYGWYIYIDYLYWLEENLLYRNCWNLVY